MIIKKTVREIELMRTAGKIVASAHQEVAKHIAPGVTTLELDQIADRVIRENGATPWEETATLFLGRGPSTWLSPQRC